LDYKLDMEQKMLKNSVRDFFSKEFDTDVMRQMEDDEKGFSPETWKKMAQNGWMGILISEKWQGEQMSLLDMGLALEEMGYAGFESPFFITAVTGVLLMEAAATEKQKEAILPKVAEGKIILTLAQLEPDTSVAVEGIRMTAENDGDGQYILNGIKMYVPYAHVADKIICAVRTGDPGKDGQGGISLFLLDTKKDGIRTKVIDTIARDKQCMVEFNNVCCTSKDLMGELNQGGLILTDILQQSAAAKCAEMAGGGRKVLKMTIDYANQRVQFGQPIAKFQAVQHHAANMLTYMDTARLMAYKTCWTIGQGEVYAKQTAICKAWVGEAYQKLVNLGHQILGGYGFMEEVDIQFFFRRAKAAGLMFGDSIFYREVLASEMGL